MDDISNEYAQKIGQPAITDEMTGLYNRRAFSEKMTELVDGLDGKIYLVVVFDVNGLKSVNDNQGHLAGDELIINASKCVSDNFSEYGNIYIGLVEMNLQLLYFCQKKECVK